MLRFAIVLALALPNNVIADELVTFEFVHGYEDKAPTYRASTNDHDVILKARSELGKPLLDRTLHIHGRLLSGSGDNAPWSWHFEENTWSLGFISTEFCDGNPKLVEEHLQDYLKVGVYCPYVARLSRELKQ